MKITMFYDEVARIRNAVDFYFDGTKEEAEDYIAAWKAGEADIWDLTMTDSEIVDIYDTWDQEYDYDDIVVVEE